MRDPRDLCLSSNTIDIMVGDWGFYQGLSCDMRAYMVMPASDVSSLTYSFRATGNREDRDRDQLERIELRRFVEVDDDLGSLGFRKLYSLQRGQGREGGCLEANQIRHCLMETMKALVFGQ